MKFTYRLIQDKNGFIAECMESDAAAEGKTAKDAVESLRKGLEERMFRPDAIAPPPAPTESVIELALADETAERSRIVRPHGPGDASRR